MKHTKKRWNASEDLMLENGLVGDLELSKLQIQLYTRTDHAIIRRAQTKGYGVHSLDNGDKIFICEVKKRKRLNGTTEAISVETTAPVILKDEKKHLYEIVSNNNVMDGTTATLQALKILNDNKLMVNPETVRELSCIIIESNRKEQ
jgi:hypothetical protein